METIITTNSQNWGALFARLALGITIFPHGAQKLLGWFGGGGFSGTMGFLTEMAGLPYILALLVILIEFFGSLLLIFGFFTRVSAVGFIGLFLGVLFTVHSENGFFMNWGMEANKGEGWEYFIMVFGLALVALIQGGGKASMDAVIAKNNHPTKPY